LIATSYDLTDFRQVQSALRELRGFWKLWSACLLQTVSLPTLRGIIVTRWYPEIVEEIHRFLRSAQATKALIRHDIRSESPPYPRGGFLAPEGLLSDVLNFFFDADRIVAVYEPADPLLNSYNLNVLFESVSNVWVEITGPGFDASDLQRGDLSPHEVFSISLAGNGEIREIDRIRRVDQPEYEESKRLRWEKIRRRLEQSPTSAIAHAIRTDLGLPKSLKKHLEALRSPVVESGPYIPIPESLVTGTVATIINSGVIELFCSETSAGFPLNFSTSLIDRGKRQVYWDIVSPALKFQGLTRSKPLRRQKTTTRARTAT